jgi:acylphosphatase
MGSLMMWTIRHLLIHGRVQGVGFRAWAQDTAEGLGVEGWVRNRRGGEVEMVIAGSPQAVAAMAEACRQGPSFAHVVQVDERDAREDELRLRGADGGFAGLPTV